jgi:cell division protein FtsQ
VSAGQVAAGRRWRARGRRSRRAAPLRPFRRRIAGAPARALSALPPKARRWLLIALGACAMLAATYQLWFRDSSFVAVEDVTVTGLTTKDAARVRAQLVSAAHTMTTLHVEKAELEQAIAAFPVVRSLEVRADFPHGLEIRVVEHRPAAIVGGMPVAGDGTILRGLPIEGRLPKVDARDDLRGSRLTAPAALHAARVAGAAPAPLRPRLDRIELRGRDGIVIELRDGPELIFGDATRVRAKWLAATRVLADPDSQGATYIDVRLPGRPAAGGLPATTLSPVAPAGSDELAAPDTATPPATAPVDPATEQLAPVPTTETQATEPQSGPQSAPQSGEPAPAPTDTTGAGGASPPAG